MCAGLNQSDLQATMAATRTQLCLSGASTSCRRCMDPGVSRGLESHPPSKCLENVDGRAHLVVVPVGPELSIGSRRLLENKRCAPVPLPNSAAGWMRLPSTGSGCVSWSLASLMNRALLCSSLCRRRSSPSGTDPWIAAGIAGMSHAGGTSRFRGLRTLHVVTSAAHHCKHGMSSFLHCCAFEGLAGCKRSPRPRLSPATRPPGGYRQHRRLMRCSGPACACVCGCVTCAWPQ